MQFRLSTLMAIVLVIAVMCWMQTNNASGFSGSGGTTTEAQMSSPTSQIPAGPAALLHEAEAVTPMWFAPRKDRLLEAYSADIRPAWGMFSLTVAVFGYMWLRDGLPLIL